MDTIKSTAPGQPEHLDSDTSAPDTVDAAHQTAVERYGLKYTLLMEDAQIRQEANLANAGLSPTAQVENAGNLLTTNMASTQLAAQADTPDATLASVPLYLQALRLTPQQEKAARASFLGMLGIQEADLALMDHFQLRSTSLMYNTYLKQFAILTQAGTSSFGDGFPGGL